MEPQINADERKLNASYQEKSKLLCGFSKESPTKKIAKYILIFSYNFALIIKTIYDR